MSRHNLWHSIRMYRDMEKDLEQLKPVVEEDKAKEEKPKVAEEDQTEKE